MSNQPPYGYDPQNPSSGYPPAYGQQPSYQPPSYPQPDYSQQQPGYPPPPPGQPGPYSQPMYGGQPGQPAPYSQPMYGAQPGMYPAGPYAPGMVMAPPARRGGVAIAALILGILSLVISFLTILDIPLIIAGIVCGAIGLTGSRKIMSAIGLGLSVLGVVAVVLWFIYFVRNGAVNQ